MTSIYRNGPGVILEKNYPIFDASEEWGANKRFDVMTTIAIIYSLVDEIERALKVNTLNTLILQ
jgi:hypothetical protein